MATRKRRSSARRRKPTRAHKATTTAAHRRHNPARRHTRRRRHNPVMAHRRRHTRRRNPGGEAVPLILGAGIAQVIASALPFSFGGVLGDAAKVAAVGWALQRVGGRTVPMLFGKAQEGGLIAAGVLVFNAYLAGPISGAVRSVIPSGGNKGVSGIALTPYPLSPATAPMLAPARAAQQAQGGMRGMATVPRMQ